MSKFNTEEKRGSMKTVNHSGAPAFKMENKLKLVTMVLTSFFNEKKFYGDNSKELITLAKEVMLADSAFVANLAIFARKEFNLRTISQVLLAELSKSTSGRKYARETTKQMILRPDDMTETVAYMLSTYGGKKNFPNSLKKGIADVFFKFDEYQLGKYNRDGKAVTLVDLLKLFHPKPVNETQKNLFDKLINDQLEIPYTWETEVSAKGNKKEVWEELINSNKMGYMATLRNLRNIIKADVSNIDKVYNYLSNETAIMKSKQLPFRFTSAFNTLKREGLGSSKIYDVLEKAIKISCKNLPILKGKTLISADVSASMHSEKISDKSDVYCSEIAVLLMAIANYLCEDAVTTTFDTTLKKIALPMSNGIISNANSINCRGGGTDIALPLRHALDNKLFFDRIIILSDNEINSTSNYSWQSRGFSVKCQSLVDRYRKEINPDVWVHAIDLQGYGTQQFLGKNINIIAGWSEKVLEFIPMAEKGIGSLLNRIEGYHFDNNKVPFSSL